MEYWNDGVSASVSRQEHQFIIPKRHHSNKKKSTMTTIKNDLTARYDKRVVIIHWLTLLFILILFPLGKIMEEMAPADKMDLLKLHVILGDLVFLLTLFRVYLYFKAPRPAHIKTGAKWNDNLAVFIQRSFYFLLIAVCVFGIATMLTGGYADAIKANDPSLMKSHSEIPTLAGHNISAMLIMFLMLLHLGGVVRHVIRTKEKIIVRMSLKK